MSQLQAASWSMVFTLAGGGLLGYLLVGYSPWQADGSLNQPLVALFLLGLVVGVTGVAAAVAMILHRRFPGLGGGSRQVPPRAGVALRQGFLFACAVLANLLLAFFDLFDVIFLLATPLLVGLLEAYLQHRPAPRR